MRIISMCVMVICFVQLATAQQSGAVVQIIKGKIINEATNEPVSYTNIGLEGTFHGTASDGDGNFELKIPSELASKNIFFSAVGFKNKVFPVNELFDREFNVVKIVPQSYDIDDVDVAGQSRVIVRILRMASENIPYNFMSGPFNLNCELEIESMVNDSVTSNETAKVSIYDKSGYANPSKMDAFQSVKYTVSKNPSPSDYSFSSGNTGIDELLKLDWVRSASSVLNPTLLAGFQLSLDEEIKVEGEECWVISFRQEDATPAGSGDFHALEMNGKIVVRKSDYSVLQIKGKTLSPKNSRQGRSIALGPEAADNYTNVATEFAVNYDSFRPESIVLERNYSQGDISHTETMKLTGFSIKTSDLQEYDKRQYFTGSSQ